MPQTTSGTVAGRPQPQTTAEAAGGPFVRHAPDGRRAMYVYTQASVGAAGFMANPMVSSPGWNKGYRVLYSITDSTTATSVGTATTDAPFSFAQLVQMKDAFGTQLLTGPGYHINFLVPLYGQQFGTDEMESIQNSPQFLPFHIPAAAGAEGAFQFPTYYPFEFAKGYGVISGANAALLPVLQVNLAPISSLFSTQPGSFSTFGAATITVDADFYWLPNVPSDPPGVGTTQQWIMQPCNPPIPSAAAQFVQLPRLGGYITTIILDLRDSTGARVTETGGSIGWPSRPRILIDGVPLIDSLFTTLQEDLAIALQVGAFSANALTNTTSTNTGTIQTPRPAGTIALSRKTGLSQRGLGLLDTGEVFISTNPGSQLEVGGFPWGTIANAPGTLNALCGQVVPSGALVRGLPEA